MHIGAFDLPASAPHFAIQLTVRADDLQASWRRCNLLANYIAEYVAYQFPEREWAENLISTVANEFLEAVVQLAAPGGDLRITCRQYEGALLLELDHPLRPELVAPYRAFLAELCGPGTADLYFAQLADATRPEAPFNQLGLLMLVHDFHARIGARHEAPDGPITVRVYVPTREIAA